MKSKATNTEKKAKFKFAFMPEMVMEHLNHAQPTITIKLEKPSKPEIQKITISAEPQIPDLDSFFETIPKKDNKIY
jgi:hypothetical protein